MRTLINQHDIVLAQVLDKVIAGGSLSTVVPGKHPDTAIQVRNMWKLHSRWEFKARIGKRATEYSVTVSVHNFSYHLIAEWKYHAHISTM